MAAIELPTRAPASGPLSDTDTDLVLHGPSIRVRATKPVKPVREKNPRRRRAVTVTVTAATVALGALALAVTTAAPPAPDAATHLPVDTVATLAINVDPPWLTKMQLAGTPGAQQSTTSIAGTLTTSWFGPSASYPVDVAPWIGERATLAAIRTISPTGTAFGPLRRVAVIDTADPQAALAAANKAATAGVPVSAAVDGNTLLLAPDPATLNTWQERLTHATLADNPAYTADTAGTSAALAVAWVDRPQLATTPDAGAQTVDQLAAAWNAPAYNASPPTSSPAPIPMTGEADPLYPGTSWTPPPTPPATAEFPRTVTDPQSAFVDPLRNVAGTPDPSPVLTRRLPPLIAAVSTAITAAADSTARIVAVAEPGQDGITIATAFPGSGPATTSGGETVDLAGALGQLPATTAIAVAANNLPALLANSAAAESLSRAFTVNNTITDAIDGPSVLAISPAGSIAFGAWTRSATDTAAGLAAITNPANPNGSAAPTPTVTAITPTEATAPGSGWVWAGTDPAWLTAITRPTEPRLGDSAAFTDHVDRDQPGTVIGWTAAPGSATGHQGVDMLRALPTTHTYTRAYPGPAGWTLLTDMFDV